MSYYNDIEKPIAELFLTTYPKSRFEFKQINDTLFFKSWFEKGQDEKMFVQFHVRDDSIINIKTINKYLPEVKKLLTINKMKRSDFNIVLGLFDQLLSNENFSKTLTIHQNLKINEMFSFKREGTTSGFTLPFRTATDIYSRFQCKLRKGIFSYHYENHFKMKRDGTILLVPVITFFDHQKNEQRYAFNIYEQTIHCIKDEEFYFEDYFENSTLFDPIYHGDVFIDSYIDNYILNELEDDDDVRQELILYPREQLSGKVDLLSMYMI